MEMQCESEALDTSAEASSVSASTLGHASRELISIAPIIHKSNKRRKSPEQKFPGSPKRRLKGTGSGQTTRKRQRSPAHNYTSKIDFNGQSTANGDQEVTNKEAGSSLKLKKQKTDNSNSAINTNDEVVEGKGGIEYADLPELIDPDSIPTTGEVLDEFPQRLHPPDGYEESDTEDDSNDEGNWRNDYPDESDFEGEDDDREYSDNDWSDEEYVSRKSWVQNSVSDDEVAACSSKFAQMMRDFRKDRVTVDGPILSNARELDECSFHTDDDSSDDHDYVHSSVVRSRFFDDGIADEVVSSESHSE